ncbi:hypothetical protein [Flavobacterium flavipallidum]|uniref:Glycosyl transferase family 8 n=1 Tax=Flavobacterium flavipallidum TaxID=3139140 RepID=A0ABU9HJ51_9FLAO
MEAICTIITGNYGHYALALHDSILKFNSSIHFYIFVSEGDLEELIKNEIKKRTNVHLLSRLDFKDSVLTEKLYDKYAVNSHDALRWSMKPVVMNYLLNSIYERVVYVDSDIHFFGDYQFLFESLKTNAILLSPHWRSSNPKVDFDNFKLNFLDGIYNGGFIGASRLGKEALEYWATLCLFSCEVNRIEGFFVDQKYLDLLPSRFQNVESIRHKGCNVANWNQIDCERTFNESGEILINNKYPIVFIHFTKSFFRGVLKESDSKLLSYLEYYRDVLLKYSSNDVIQEFLKDENKIQNKIEKRKSFILIQFCRKVKEKIICFYSKFQ